MRQVNASKAGRTCADAGRALDRDRRHRNAYRSRSWALFCTT
jgi:hypothetical protein